MYSTLELNELFQILNSVKGSKLNKPHWSNTTLDVIFVAKRDIQVDEEIVWDYGKNYTGVNPCVTLCLKCKNVNK